MAEADRIIKELKSYTDTKFLGLMSFILSNQKTGVLWRAAGTAAPWYGRDGDGTYMLDFESAVAFKKLHEISQNSVEISQELHDAITSTTTVVNVSGRSVQEIADAVSATDSDFLNG